MTRYLYLLVIICWWLFGLVWIIGAIYNHYKTPVLKKRTNFMVIWPLMIILWLVLKCIPGSFYEFITYNAKWVKVSGALLLVLSTAFTIWSRVILGRMWASNAVIKEGHNLHTDGPYSITRHPIYTGMLGMIFGSMLINGIGWALFVFVSMVIFFEIKIYYEEKLLIDTFGEEYLEFKRRIPQLLPTFKFFKNRD